MRNVFFIRAAALFLLLLIFSSPVSARWDMGISDGYNKITQDILDLKKELNETRETLGSAGRFLGSVKSGVETVVSAAGGKAVLLFFVILIISSGLGAAGLPKGGFTFFLSLIIADILWILWGRSSNADMVSHILIILKNNLIVLIPFAGVLLLRHLVCAASEKFSYIIRPLFEIKKRKSAEELSFLTERIIGEANNLAESLSKDIQTHKDKEGVFLSKTSRLNIDEMKKILDKLS